MTDEHRNAIMLSAIEDGKNGRIDKELSQFDNKKPGKLESDKPCNTTLSLTHYQRERLVGLTSILYFSLQNCNDSQNKHLRCLC